LGRPGCDTTANQLHCGTRPMGNGSPPSQPH
jgi:hypothetical protein